MVAKSRLHILAFDIGGSYLKAALIDASGRMLTERVKVPTPPGCLPKQMVDLLVQLVEPLPPHDRISIGFPGVVRAGKVLTAPHWGTAKWANFALAGTLSKRLGGSPARLINDAEMQGLAVIKGNGLELVLTLGTGAGTGLFRDGEIMPHLELAHHPIYKSQTYNDYIGNAALAKHGKKHWNKRVGNTIEILDSLLHYDHLYIGGGNSSRVTLRLPPQVTLVSNDAGIEGGAALWHGAVRASA
jgi:polyphosphate glucokinase